MSSFDFPGCFIPSHFVGPCNQSVIRHGNGSVFYNATAPYVGPRADSEYTIRDINGTVLYNATELCKWVMPFDADPDIVSIRVVFYYDDLLICDRLG